MAEPPVPAGRFALANSIVVKSATGSDRFYSTLALAKAGAVSGETVVVGPGSYTVTASLAKNGVNWNFAVGASVSMSTDSTTAIWDDGGSAMTFKVVGFGNFSRYVDFQESAVIKVAHVSSVIRVEALDLYGESTNNNSDCYGVTSINGSLTVTARNIGIGARADVASGVWWKNGYCSVTADVITGGYASVTSAVDTTPNGDCHVIARESHSQYGVSSYGTNSTAALWTTFDIIFGETNAVYSNGGAQNRIYVTAQKMFGLVANNGGLFYINANKLSSQDGTGLVSSSAGTSYISINQYDAAECATAPISVTGGACNILGGILNGVGQADTTLNGVTISSGTATLSNFQADASSATSGNPVSKSGGTLTLESSVLTAATGRDSITAGTSQGVTSYNSTANRAVNANITISGNLSIAGAIPAQWLGSGGALAYDATLVPGIQSLSGAGAVNLTTGSTAFTSTGSAQALTLANGAVGQIKRICHVVDGGSGVLSPTTKSGYSTITFTNAGDAVTLQYHTTAGWVITGSFGVTIA